MTDKQNNDRSIDNLENNLEDNLEIHISPDGLCATLPPQKISDENLHLEKIMAALEQNGIVYGVIDPYQIENHLRSKAYQKIPLKLAVGKPKREGQSARVNYFFEMDYLKPGKLMPNDRMDYRERGDVPFVSAGDRLAEKIPPIIGESGRTIFDEEIEIKAVQDENLTSGKGTAWQSDGTTLVATLKGTPHSTLGGKVSVFPDKDFEGDIGYQTGHVKFDGNVNVKGCIQDGFRVKCVHLTAKEIDNAQIETRGDVVVKEGIIGAEIYAKGNVEATHIANSTIIALGHVTVKKQIIDSKILISGEINSEQGKIISSSISAKKGVSANQIGTDTSPSSTLKVGTNDHLESEILRFDKIINTNKEIVEHLQKIIDTDKKRLFESFQTADKKIDTKQLNKEIIGNEAQAQKIKQKIEELAIERNALIELSKREAGIPQIQVKGTLFAGTKILGPKTSLIIRNPMKNVRICETRKIKSNQETDWEMEVVPLL